jgi:hypothetical protein
VEKPATLSLVDLMAAPEQWVGKKVTVIAPIRGGKGSRELGIASTGTQSSNAAPSLWLANPLPEGVAAELPDGLGYLKLAGTLSPPGAYGTDGRFPYQFAAETAAALEAGRTTLQHLTANPHTFDGTVLDLSGILIAAPDGALLTDNISPGGVPGADARQIKLRMASTEGLPGLQTRGDVRYGPVMLSGWWQNNVLTPFEIRPK